MISRAQGATLAEEARRPPPGPASGQLDYMTAPVDGFGDIGHAIDAPLGRVDCTDSSATETWWWSFHVPERDLNGEIYLWKHSTLDMWSGGVWIFQGIKAHHLLCEHFNFRNWLGPVTVAGGILRSAELGLEIEVVEPLTRHRIRYDNLDLRTSIALETRSLQPPVMRSGNAHFEQVQHVEGVLVLNGETIAIDCMAMRDRSWGEARPEAIVAHPPILWGVGVSADGATSFNINGTDDPRRDPLCASYGIDPETTLKAGWIYRDNALHRLVSLSKLTVREPNSLQARSYDCTLIDSTGRSYELSGEVRAAATWSPWPNMAAHFGQLVRWRLDGAELYGEAQEVFWSDCIRRLLGVASPSAILRSR